MISLSFSGDGVGAYEWDSGGGRIVDPVLATG